jgi:hypothetical protein
VDSLGGAGTLSPEENRVVGRKRETVVATDPDVVIRISRDRRS